MRTTTAALLLTCLLPPFASADDPAAAGSGVQGDVSGREIFVREWVANDPRSHGGDGLGPVFNGSSCVTCHNQGGAGGAGAFDENVTLLSATFPAILQAEESAPGTGPAPSVDSGRTSPFEVAREKSRKQLAEALHPDFAKGDTVVLHRFGNAPAHRNWLNRVRNGLITRVQSPNVSFLSPSDPTPVATTLQSFDGPVPVAVAESPIGQPFTEVAQSLEQPINVGDLVVQVQPGHGNSSFPILNRVSSELNTLKSNSRSSTASSFAFHNAVMQTSQRNTTALWGVGLVDRIPTRAIEEIASRQKKAGGRVSGRVHRLPDGRIGKFGWKAQKASLYDFTMAACAVELGLHVPGENQATVPYDKEYEATGLDLTKHEVDALVDYIADLPKPGVLKPAHDEVARLLGDGEQLFNEVGCAECHQKDVGEVSGIYTDFLLHDMGPDLGSVGSYGVPSVPEPDPDVPVAAAVKSRPVPPTSREWRTPALWGVRDSAPYLHDGRARTIEQAVAFHGGEAAQSRLRFMMLEDDERAKVLSFLKSLVAPNSVAAAE